MEKPSAKVNRRGGVGGSRNNAVEVLLADHVDNLGQAGEIVRVKPGYARNYLLPHGLATVATEDNKRRVERHKEKLEVYRREQIRDKKQLADRISAHTATIEANASPEGQLYGSIMADQISQSLQASGYEVQPEHIKLDGPLKVLGMYTIKVQLDREVETEFKVWVVPTSTTDAAAR